MESIAICLGGVRVPKEDAISIPCTEIVSFSLELRHNRWNQMGFHMESYGIPRECCHTTFHMESYLQEHVIDLCFLDQLHIKLHQPKT